MAGLARDCPRMVAEGLGPETLSRVPRISLWWQYAGVLKAVHWSSPGVVFEGSRQEYKAPSWRFDIHQGKVRVAKLTVRLRLLDYP